MNGLRRGPGFRQRLAANGVNGLTLLLLPALFVVLALFIYPFLYGLWLSFAPKHGGALANYREFFGNPYMYSTVMKTMWLAVPETLLAVMVSVPVALRMRRLYRQKLLMTILVVPITLGTVLVAEGLLTYLGPSGWLNKVLLATGLIRHPVLLVHNYWGVFMSQLIAVFPLTFLLTYSYVTGINPSLEKAGAMLGARAWQRFRYIILPLLVPGLMVTIGLSFVQNFSVFPSAILVGNPAGSTRVMTIAAYHAAFEEYDYSMASAITMIMAVVQGLVFAALLVCKSLAYRGSTSTVKG